MSHKKLTNIELVLLQIVCQQKSISGYQIDKLIADRGYRNWVDIGSASIYLGLSKLQKNQLVESYFDTHKQGKGPPPRLFSITLNGRAKLESQILEALISPGVCESRFYLGIAGIPFIKRNEAVEALKDRRVRLGKKADEIKSQFDDVGGRHLKFHLRVLYEHSINAIRNEIRYLDSLIDEFAEFALSEPTSDSTSPPAN